MNEWRPIETAPRDGTRVLTCYRGVDVKVNYFNNPEGSTMSIGRKAWWCSEPHRQPTHWLPIPPPPTTP